MENNTTPPKEIFVSKDFAEFSTLEVITPKGLETFSIKYLSEQSVLEMLAEKDREIEILREGEKALIDSIQILRGMVKNK